MRSTDCGAAGATRQSAEGTPSLIALEVNPGRCPLIPYRCAGTVISRGTSTRPHQPMLRTPVRGTAHESNHAQASPHRPLTSIGHSGLASSSARQIARVRTHRRGRPWRTSWSREHAPVWLRTLNPACSAVYKRLDSWRGACRPGAAKAGNRGKLGSSPYMPTLAVLMSRSEESSEHAAPDRPSYKNASDPPKTDAQP